MPNVRFKLLDIYTSMFICFFLHVTLSHLRVHDIALHHGTFIWFWSVFNRVSQSPHAFALQCSVWVFYRLVQVSLSISSLLQIRGIFVRLLYKQDTTATYIIYSTSTVTYTTCTITISILVFWIAELHYIAKA